MSSGCLIGKVNKDNTITSIISRFEGMPSHTGFLLITKYVSEGIIDELFKLGDIESLRSSLIPNQELSHTFLHFQWDVVLSYSRDGHKSGHDAVICKNEAEFRSRAKDCCCKFIYLYRDGQWSVSVPHKNKWIKDSSDNFIIANAILYPECYKAKSISKDLNFCMGRV